MTGQPVTRRITIPACDEHEGILTSTVRLLWVCPVCQGPRGDVYPTVSYDGSRRLDCDGWQNPCGHVDKYFAVREEAKRNGLNQPHNWYAPTLDDWTADDEAEARADADEPSFEEAIDSLTTAWREAATDTQILVRDDRGKLVPFVDEPLPSDSDHDAVMFLTEEEADFMRTICLFDGLLVYPHQRAEIIMTAKLEKGGLVTVQRADGYVVVSAVRPEEGEE